jgi:hypothetical protein
MAKKKDSVSNIADEGLKRVAEEQKFFENILEDLNTNPKYTEFFNRYHPDSVLRFKESFGKYKANCLLYGDSYIKMEEKKAMQYREDAVNCFWEIQQKKLFTAQCRWRAGLINIPGIVYTNEFKILEYKITSCPFITPVSKEDVDEYIQYLGEIADEGVFNFEEYQDYDKMTGKYWREKPDPITYYKWWYSKHGDEEIQLPDKRGERERYYWKETVKEGQALAEKTKAEPSYDNRPALSSFYGWGKDDKDHLRLFLETFEDKKTAAKYLEYRKLKKEIDHMYSEWDYFDEMIELLKEAGDDFPVEYNNDWHYGLIHAGIRYKQSMVAKILPDIYREYLFRINSGIAPEKPDYYDHSEQQLFFLNKRKKDIQRGRELLGEEGEYTVE